MRNCILFIAFAIVASCNSTVEKPKDEAKPEDWYHLLEKFSLPHSRNLVNSDSSFMFIKDKPWDTSFVLILQRRPNNVKGVYYHTTVNYHTNLNDFLNDKQESLYFEGFSFVTDTLKWNEIITEINSLEYSTDSFENDGCLDGGVFLASYNSKVMFGFCSNTTDYDSFIKFERTLKAILLNSILKSKHTIGERADIEMAK